MDERAPGIITILIGIWLTIWLALWFFGVRDAFWPPWPMKTECQKIEQRYEGVLYDPAGPNTIEGPAFAMEELADAGCIELTD